MEGPLPPRHHDPASAAGQGQTARSHVTKVPSTTSWATATITAQRLVVRPPGGGLPCLSVTAHFRGEDSGGSPNTASSRCRSGTPAHRLPDPSSPTRRSVSARPIDLICAPELMSAGGIPGRPGRQIRHQAVASARYGASRECGHLPCRIAEYSRLTSAVLHRDTRVQGGLAAVNCGHAWCAGDLDACAGYRGHSACGLEVRRRPLGCCTAGWSSCGSRPVMRVIVTTCCAGSPALWLRQQGLDGVGGELGAVEAVEGMGPAEGLVMVGVVGEDVFGGAADLGYAGVSGESSSCVPLLE